MRLERQIAEEQGNFRLFGLFLREDSYDKWDVVVAAPWFNKLPTDAIEFIARRLKSAIGSSGLMMISRIIPLPDKNDFLVAVNGMVKVQHGLREIMDVDLAGVQISRGYVITSESASS